MRAWKIGTAAVGVLLLLLGGLGLATLFSTPEPVLGEPIVVIVNGPLPTASPDAPPGTLAPNVGDETGAGTVPIAPPSRAGDDDGDDDNDDDDDDDNDDDDDDY